MSTTSYTPGVCNIGPAEIKTRKFSGTVGLFTTAILFAVLLVTDVQPHAWRLILFIPATISALGYLQAKLHFCVRFGTTGLFNMSNSLIGRETVKKAEYRRKDQRKAVIIASLSAAIGLIVAVVVFILP